MDKLRIGQGFDVHPFAHGRRLMIGGVEIPHNRGLAGHSDADVLVHAICDALLGAAGLPDIGHYFPPSDAGFKDISSLKLLTDVKALVVKAGFTRIINVDCIILAERPKVAQYIPAMKQQLAAVLGIFPGCIGIKATTCEKLGFIGREEGIAATAVCLIAAHD